MDTGDSKDFKVECGKVHNFGWSGSSWSSEMVKHDKVGKFVLTLDDDCTSTIEDVSGSTGYAQS